MINQNFSDKPTVLITSPASGSQFQEGQDVHIQSISADARGITRVELLLDGIPIREDTVVSPQAQYNLIQVWKAIPGQHTLSVRAYNAANISSDPAILEITGTPAFAQRVTSPPPAVPNYAPVMMPPPAPIAPAVGSRSLGPMLSFLGLGTFVLVAAVIAFFVLFNPLGKSSEKPTVAITSPQTGGQLQAGQDVVIQSLSTNSNITRIELQVDGNIIRADPVAPGQFNLSQTWKATPGTHTVSVRVFNANNVASDPASIAVTVSPAVSQASSPITPTVIAIAPIPPSGAGITPSAVQACTNNAAFVADITTPAGTTIASGGAFNKTWRVQNNGTCTWGVGYDFTLVSGEAMGSTTVIAVPSTAPGGTADISVAMIAPSGTGAHSGQWQLRANAVPFGGAFSVSINVATTAVSSSSVQPQPAAPPPAPAACPGPPVIASFTASPTTITAGSATTLNWGAVSNATAATIDHGIGGVPTPGNRSVSPASTTTYILTATGCGGTAISQVTVTVNPSVAVSSSSSSSSSSSKTCAPNADQVALFTEVNFGGQCVTLGRGPYRNDSDLGIPNDTVSSVKVGGNVKGVLCQAYDWDAVCETFTSDVADLRFNHSVGNDTISSALILGKNVCAPTANQITLHTEINNGGQCVTLGIGNYPTDTQLGIPNDTVSSVQVGSKVKVNLCSAFNFGGSCQTFSNSGSTDLRNGSTVGNDTVSSAIVQLK
ncbi:MAG: hypothetical protein HZB51_06925 [Chloroflexi bacterium]|nr:hypothetical protein [Chloroflexota bacterium]